MWRLIGRWRFALIVGIVMLGGSSARAVPTHSGTGAAWLTVQRRLPRVRVLYPTWLPTRFHVPAQIGGIGTDPRTPPFYNVYYRDRAGDVLSFFLGGTNYDAPTSSVRVNVRGVQGWLLVWSPGPRLGPGEYPGLLVIWREHKILYAVGAGGTHTSQAEILRIVAHLAPMPPAHTTSYH